MSDALSRLLDAVAPPLTIRRQFLLLCRQVPSVLQSEGVAATSRRTWKAYQRYRNTGALIIPDPSTVQPAPQREPEPYPYEEWIAVTEPGAEDLARQRQQLAFLAHRPLISVVVPVYDPPAKCLAAAIDSVLAQSYPYWQLCLADGASTNPEVAGILARYADEDRIVVTRLEQNLGISGNSNAALALAKGDYVALLDHDDTLAPNALYEVASLLSSRPETDIVYFDEDKLSADGSVRNHPWFKPDFSPDLMLSGNLLMHGVFRRALLHEAGGLDPETDGAQDWDLALRCTRRTDAIRHIPKILYHWRQVPGSAALDANAKPWAFDAQARVLERHIEAIDGVRPRIEFPSLGRTRVVWPEPAARVSIVIPTKDKRDLLQACLDSVFAHTSYADYEIILVDTGSVEHETHAYYDELLSERDNVKIVHLPGPFNYSRACNVGAENASGQLLLFLNNDTEILEPGWLSELAGWASRPGVGVVGAKLLRPNGLIQHAGVIIGLAGHGSHIFEDSAEGTYGIFGSTEWYRNYYAVTGACMMVPAKLFAELGGFDEVYQIGYSDIELCLRAGHMGYRTVYTPFARLLHREGSSRGLYVPPSDVLRASCQMLPLIRQGDRHFNPNLSLRHRKPALARPDEPGAASNVVEIMRDYGLLPPHLGDTAPPLEDVELATPAPWPETRSRKAHRSPETISVLLVSHDLSRSGAPLAMASLAEGLAKTGMRLTVITPEDGPVRDEFEAAGVSVQVDGSVQESLQIATPLTRLGVGALTRAIQSQDLVLANSIVNALAVNTAIAFDIPCLFWLHESQYGRDLAAQDLSVRAALRNAGCVVIPTRALAGLYGDLLPDDRVVVIPHGVDQNTLAASAGGVELPPDKVRVVSVGSLEPRKGQDFLLSAIRKLPRSERDRMEFYFLGRALDPEFSKTLQQQTARSRNIHWTGNLSRADVMSYLTRADVYVLSSQDEVLPGSLIEAMYHGLAVIATRVGGVPEIVCDGEDGLIVDFGDRRAMARALATLARDPELRARLGENAGRTIRNRYTMNAFVDRFLDLITTATNTTRTAVVNSGQP